MSPTLRSSASNSQLQTPTPQPGSKRPSTTDLIRSSTPSTSLTNVHKRQRLTATDRRVNLLETGRWSDFKIHCSGKTFNVHRAVLLGVSPYLDRVIDDGEEGGPKFKEGEDQEVDLSDLDPEALGIILKLIYMDAAPKGLSVLDACPGQALQTVDSKHIQQTPITNHAQATTDYHQIMSRTSLGPGALQQPGPSAALPNTSQHTEVVAPTTSSNLAPARDVSHAAQGSGASTPTEYGFDTAKLRLGFKLYIAADRLLLPAIKEWSFAAIVSNLAKLVRWPVKDHFLDIFETIAEDVFGAPTYADEEGEETQHYEHERLKSVVAFAGLLATWFGSPVRADDLSHAGQTIPELGWYLFDLQRREMERCRKCYGCPRYPFSKHCKFLAVSTSASERDSGFTTSYSTSTSTANTNTLTTMASGGTTNGAKIEWIRCFCFFGGLCSTQCLVDEGVEEIRAYCHQCAKTMNPARIHSAFPYERRGGKIVLGGGGVNSRSGPDVAKFM